MMVDPRKGQVKRRYDSSRRRERSAATRARTLDCGRALLLADGYAATTVTSIAADAGVSPETVYRLFGGKAGLVRAICEHALEGAGPVPAQQRSDLLQVTERDALTVIRGWSALIAEVSPRISPVLLLVRAAAAVDAEMAELRAALDDARLDRMTHNAESLLRSGQVRLGVTRRDAAEILWAYTAPEWYEMLVVDRGWTPTKYADFVTDSIAAALLGHRQGPPVQRPV